jgi:microcystin-dependent protein
VGVPEHENRIAGLEKGVLLDEAWARTSQGGLVTSQDLVNSLPLFTATTKGVVPPSGGGSANFLRADGLWVPLSGVPVWANYTVGGNTTVTGAAPGTILPWTLVDSSGSSDFGLTSGNTLTFAAAGQYEVTASISFQAVAGAAWAILTARWIQAIGPTTVDRRVVGEGSAAAIFDQISISLVVDAKAGDTLAFFVQPQTANNTVDGRSWLSIRKLVAGAQGPPGPMGPSGTTGIDTRTKVRLSTTPQITPLSTILLLDFKAYDTLNSYTPATGIFVAPQSGSYRIAAQLLGSAMSPASNQQIQMSLTVNGSTVATTRSDVSTSVNSLLTAQMSTTIYMNANDQLALLAWVYPSGNIQLSGWNQSDDVFLSIELLNPGQQGPAGSAGVGVVTGGVIMHGGVAAPAGFLACDGASYLRSDYTALFNIIGTNFGSVDSTHFNVPDLRSQFPYGMDTRAVPTNTPGKLVGSNAHSHPLGDTGVAEVTMLSTAAQATSFWMRRITNPAAAWTPNLTNTTAIGFAGGGGGGATGAALTGATDNNTSWVPPAVVMNFIIKT